MKPLLSLSDETLKAIAAYLSSVLDEKVLECVYRGESPDAKTVKTAIEDGIARVRREQERLRKQAQKA